MKTRSVLFVCLLGVVLLAIAGCATASPTAAPVVATPAPAATATPAATKAPEPTKAAAPSGPPVKIGVITALSGLNGAFGTDQARGAEIAVEELNAAGGIMGRPVVLIERDDKLVAAEASKNAEDLITNEKVDMLTGGVSGATTVALDAVTKRAGVLHFAAPQSNDLNTAAGRGPYTFHMITTGYMNVNALAPYVLKNLGTKVFYLIYDFALGNDYITALDNVLNKQDLKKIGVIKVPLGTTDYSSILPQVRAAKPDVLVYFISGSDRAAMLKQATSFGMQKEMKFVSVLADLPWDAEAGFANIEGEYGPNQFYWEMQDKVPGAKKFVEAYANKFKTPPGAYAALMYQIVKVYKAGVEKAGSTDPGKVTAALEALGPFDFVLGNAFIRKCDHQLFAPYYIARGRSESAAKAIQPWPQFAFRELVTQVPADESLERTCEQLGFK